MRGGMSLSRHACARVATPHANGTRSAESIRFAGSGNSIMLAKVHSFILVRIDPLRSEAEVAVSDRGREKTRIVGLPQAAVKESIERVRRAVINSGYAFPRHHLLVNLAPADVKKEGPALDL